MKIKTAFLSLAFAGLFGAAQSAVGSPTAIVQADALFSARTSTAGASEALALYEKAITEDAPSSALFWKAARACYWVGEHAESKKRKLASFQKGIDFAQKAAELDPRSVEAHFWLAALYGSYGEAKGVLKSLMMLKPMRKELDAVNRLNDRYQGGAGYRVLGVVDYKVPGFAGGSKQRAIEQLNKALAIDPENPFNQYYVAEFFATAQGDKKKALEHLQILERLSTSEDVDRADLALIQRKGELLRRQIGT